MVTEVKIPAMGESITSGILATWHVKPDAVVDVGQSLFDLETDKITSEATAEVAGRIEILAKEGDEVEVGAVVARIHPADTKASASPATSDSNKKVESARPDDDKTDTAYPPSVRRLADESGIDPKSVSGSGKAGRVTKGDMLEAISAAKDKPATKAAPATPEPSDKPASSPSNPAASGSTRKKMSPLRRTIAQRLVQAQQTTAMLTTFNEVDMSKVMELRKVHQEAFVGRHGVKLGFMSFFVKAVVQALKDNPGINAQIDGDEIVSFNHYDIGVAVSTPKGLMVPVLRDCDDKSFAAIEKDILHYAGKARDGKITLDDLQGGVFTITNGGIFGSMLSTPILNTPQSAILGMHTIQERPVAIAGEVVIRPMMYLALSYDHRLVDGKEAVTFLVGVKKAIEDPNRLLFGI